jgi:helix-turn-helix protein
MPMKKSKNKELGTIYNQESIPTTAHGDEQWYDNSDLKRLFNFSDSTLYRLRKKGALPFGKLGGKICYPKSYFNRTFLQQCLRQLKRPSKE